MTTSIRWCPCRVGDHEGQERLLHFALLAAPVPVTINCSTVLLVTMALEVEGCKAARVTNTTLVDSELCDKLEDGLCNMMQQQSVLYAE